MRSFLSTLVLAVVLLAPGCMASPDEAALASGALDNDPRDEFDTSCHIQSSGPYGGDIIDGTRDGIWCCGSTLCDNEETCGDDYGHYVESCGRCDHYECIPGSGLGPKGNEGGTTPPTVDHAIVAELAERARDYPEPTARLDVIASELIETVDRTRERELLGYNSEDANGLRCDVVDLPIDGGEFWAGECCGVPVCTDRDACDPSLSDKICVTTDGAVVLTTSIQRL